MVIKMSQADAYPCWAVARGPFARFIPDILSPNADRFSTKQYGGVRNWQLLTERNAARVAHSSIQALRLLATSEAGGS
jgi:hypothetical protein